MAISKLGVIHPRLEIVGVEILSSFFCGMILDPAMLENQSRALKTGMIV